MEKTLKSRGYKWLMLTLVFTSLGASAETFLCVTDKATGFNKQGNNEWEPSTLLSNSKYTLKHEDGTWWWTEIGSSIKDFCKAKKREVFACQTTKGHLVFNKKLMRFVFSYPGGYALEQFKNDSTSIEIGKCSPL